MLDEKRIESYFDTLPNHYSLTSYLDEKRIERRLRNHQLEGLSNALDEKRIERLISLFLVITLYSSISMKRGLKAAIPQLSEVYPLDPISMKRGLKGDILLVYF